MKPKDPKTIYIKSIYGRLNRAPIVEIILGNEVAQWDPDTARHIARQLFEAAESAEQDGFIVDFMMKKVGVNEQAATQVLIEYREYKEQRKIQADLEPPHDSFIGDAPPDPKP